MKITWGIFTWASPLTNSHFSALKNDPFFEFQFCNEIEIRFFSLKQILVSPNLSQLSWSLKCQFPMRMKYYFTRNKSLWQFPQIWVNVKAGESWSPPCEAVFRHFVMKKVNRSDSISTFMYVGGLINRFHTVSCPRSDSTRPLLFSHPLSGGHRSRPSLLGRQGYLDWMDGWDGLDHCVGRV